MCVTIFYVGIEVQFVTRIVLVVMKEEVFKRSEGLPVRAYGRENTLYGVECDWQCGMIVNLEGRKERNRKIGRKVKESSSRHSAVLFESLLLQSCINFLEQYLFAKRDKRKATIELLGDYGL